MNASRFFGTLVRISRGVGAALTAWGRRKAPPHRQGFEQDPVAITAPMQLAEAASIEAAPVSIPAAFPEPVSMPAQPLAAQPAPAEPAAVKMRSIEEIRADLARLRQNAKERHAELRAQQQVSFQATDLLEIAPNLPEPKPKPEPAQRDSSETAFAATAFADFGLMKQRGER
jgi:hypothetical protein